jgi:hypothetical protein
MPNTTHSCAMGHQISFPIASLMQDAMKMASSQTTFFDQFHTNSSYMETLSCFIYKMNCKNYYSRVNFERDSSNVVIICKSQLLIIRLNPNPNLKSKP